MYVIKELSGKRLRILEVVTKLKKAKVVGSNSRTHLSLFKLTFENIDDINIYATPHRSKS